MELFFLKIIFISFRILTMLYIAKVNLKYEIFYGYKFLDVYNNALIQIQSITMKLKGYKSILKVLNCELHIK